MHVGAASHCIEAVLARAALLWWAQRVKHDLPTRVDRKLHGGARQQVQRVADALGDRDLAAKA